MSTIVANRSTIDYFVIIRQVVLTCILENTHESELGITILCFYIRNELISIDVHFLGSPVVFCYEWKCFTKRFRRPPVNLIAVIDNRLLDSQIIGQWRLVVFR